MARRVVLLIDERTDSREAVSHLLELEGYAVVCAPGSGEALRMLRLGLRPCVILLDLIVPGDGLSFRVQQISDPELASIPVIGGSTIGRTQDHIEPRYRVRHLMLKPFDFDRLLALIADVCAAAEPATI